MDSIHGRRIILKSIEIKRKKTQIKRRKAQSKRKNKARLVILTIHPTINPTSTPMHAPISPSKYATIHRIEVTHVPIPQPMKPPSKQPKIAPTIGHRQRNASSPSTGSWKGNANINDIQMMIGPHIGKVSKRIIPAHIHQATASIGAKI